MDTSLTSDLIAVLESLKDSVANTPGAVARIDGLLVRLKAPVTSEPVVAVVPPVPSPSPSLPAVAVDGRRSEVRDSGEHDQHTAEKLKLA